MDKGKNKANNIFKLLTTQKFIYSKTNKIIFSTFYKAFTNIASANIVPKFIKKFYTYINVIIKEINIYILTVKARYTKTFYYKIITITRRRRLRGILLLLLQCLFINSFII